MKTSWGCSSAIYQLISLNTESQHDAKAKNFVDTIAAPRVPKQALSEQDRNERQLPCSSASSSNNGE